jgi:glycosyltransferase involved in cell wall biosynthesis
MIRLRTLAAQLGIGQHVEFTGRKPRNELRYYYSACDAFVTTPWYEPFGITPVEAMACARPVIGAEVGGIKSTVVDGETGFLVRPRDPEGVCERLAQLRATPDMSTAMGDEGLRRAHQHYTWRTVASKTEAVYAKAARHGATHPHMRGEQPGGQAADRPVSGSNFP